MAIIQANDNHPTSRIQRAARILAWALAAAIAILSVVPPGLRPETGAPRPLEHFAIYCATGLAFGLGYRRRHDLFAVFLVMYSGAVETAQLFIPGRHARMSDFIIDSLAACFGLLIVTLASRLRGRDWR